MQIVERNPKVGHLGFRMRFKVVHYRTNCLGEEWCRRARARCLLSTAYYQLSPRVVFKLEAPATSANLTAAPVLAAMSYLGELILQLPTLLAL
jgi:hypothetical protein